ncbi:hypothetical protein D3Z36_03170 [Lachnospiraceae bacterium]|nr:hypothetical protein [Lachnospiraceae bacterium]
MHKHRFSSSEELNHVTMAYVYVYYNHAYSRHIPPH